MKKLFLLTLVCIGTIAAAAEPAYIDKFKSLADQGNADAGFCLGMAYGSGASVRQDTKQAMHWFQIAAKKGHPIAEFMMGKAHYNGWEMKKNYAEAANWFRCSADKGFAPAQYWLRRAHENMEK